MEVSAILYSDKYHSKTGRYYFYNIMPISNIESIAKYGLLSHEEIVRKKITHSDVSMPEVQERRKSVKIPNGLELHQYANLYLNARNPMMYKLRCNVKDFQNSICVLGISTRILDELDDLVLTDRNASVGYVRFYSVAEGIESIDFGTVFSKYWNDTDEIEKWKKKAIQCAEVLVPKHIDSKYIEIAAVCSETAKGKLETLNFPNKIIVHKPFFFC